MPLTQFTGTERYYRISRRHLLTDGTKYPFIDVFMYHQKIHVN
jgi:hypothetical protein